VEKDILKIRRRHIFLKGQVDRISRVTIPPINHGDVIA
jgi:hypothetical protein